MDIFAIGFAVFGALVCMSAVVTEHRQRVGGGNSLRSHLEELNRSAQSSLTLVDTGAIATGERSRRRSDIDIYGVEVESDFEESDGAFERNGERVSDAPTE